MDPKLTDVPETMLWTLHNRASEASRSDGMLSDPDAVRIYDAISYEYERSFGPAEPSHAVRSAMFDHEIRSFLDENEDGVVVNLGEGLETQRFRVAGAKALWLCVDLPEAIDIRERFIEPDDAHHHVRCSVLDRGWFERVDASRPVIITAQGLLMFLEEEQVRSLLRDLAEQFPGALLVFDVIPRWLSQRTMGPDGWKKTANYTTPKMPWGINRHEIAPTLQKWLPDFAEVSVLSWWRFPRGVGRWLFPILVSLPLIGRYTPAVVRVRLPER